jgi:hypothetical protein
MKTKTTRKKPLKKQTPNPAACIKPERLTVLAIHSMLDEQDWASVEGLALHLYRLAQRRQA